ncbi:MAG: Dabb family protein [Planctomycetota bacterium]
MEAEPQIAHMVYFTLKDSAGRQALVDSCQKHLTNHPGTVYFSVGVRGESFTRPVNDDQFDVALHVVFENMEAHDTYQESPRHVQFIEENKATWKQVRVFDSLV